MDERDFIFLEQDVIFKGDIIGKLYEQMGDHDFIFGQQMKSHPFMRSSQSVFLIRHKYIPFFVQKYLSLGKDGSIDWLPEDKFAEFDKFNGCRSNLLVDRCRPIPWDDDIFAVQKLTMDELEEAKRRGIV